MFLRNIQVTLSEIGGKHCLCVNCDGEKHVDGVNVLKLHAPVLSSGAVPRAGLEN